MKIVAIVGSNRRGNTYSMVEAACHALEEFNVELVHLQRLSISPCDGCLSCDETGECHIEDDMQNVIKSMRDAEGFVIGTPARWSLLSGELKVLIDRLNPLAVPELLQGKKAIIFTVGQCEGDEAESIKLAAESVKYFCDNAGIEVVDTLIAEGCIEPTDVITKSPDILKKCKDSATKLSQAIHESH
ncbi:flavodoxin family protein [Chloroflexota bacterium]